MTDIDSIRIHDVSSLKATITIGRKRGYSEDLIPVSDFYTVLSDLQLELKKTLDIALSARVTESTIIFAGQNEPCLVITFINYPKFPITHQKLKEGAIFIAKHLMTLLKQRRIVVEFQDQTLMLDVNDDIDPKINLQD